MDKLYDKVYGALIGAAIGDAMGGPVEMWHYSEIERVHGWVDSLMEYPESLKLSEHGPWSRAAGTHTDDSRMSKFFCMSFVERGGACSATDLRRAYAHAFEHAQEGFPKAFLEEYYLKGIYGDEKQAFGGHPVNAAIMGIAPYGAIHPCDPQKAHDTAFEAMFISEGYSRYSAAIAAAAIAAAMIPGRTPVDAIQAAKQAVAKHRSRVEGPRWSGGDLYRYIARRNESLLEAVEPIALRHRNVKTLREELYGTVCQQFCVDGSESLAIAVCMFLAADGDYVKTVEGCVNFGRDNDSSASVGGAIAGAFCGAKAIPPEWIELVESVNQQPTFASLAKDLCAIIRTDVDQAAGVLSAQQSLIQA